MNEPPKKPRRPNIVLVRDGGGGCGFMFAIIFAILFVMEIFLSL